MIKVFRIVENTAAAVAGDNGVVPAHFLKNLRPHLYFAGFALFFSGGGQRNTTARLPYALIPVEKILIDVASKSGTLFEISIERFGVFSVESFELSPVLSKPKKAS